MGPRMRTGPMKQQVIKPGKDRGGFGVARNMEQEMEFMSQMADLFYLQRKEISVMQNTVRVYMGRQRERLERSVPVDVPTLIQSITSYEPPNLMSAASKRGEAMKEFTAAANSSFAADSGPKSGRRRRGRGRNGRAGTDSTAETDSAGIQMTDNLLTDMGTMSIEPMNVMRVAVHEPAFDQIADPALAALEQSEMEAKTVAEPVVDVESHDIVAEPSGGFIPDEGQEDYDATEPVVKDSDDKAQVDVASDGDDDDCYGPADPVVADREIPRAESTPATTAAGNGVAKATPGTAADDRLDSPVDLISDDIQGKKNADEDGGEPEPELDMTWMQYPEIPLAEELMSEKKEDDPWALSGEEAERPPVAVNKIKGAWGSVHEYLRSHYLMLREDGTMPLREAVEMLRASPYTRETDLTQSSTGIYDRVHVTGITYATTGLAVKVVFSLDRVQKQIMWAQSKRLQSGSLVALTPANDHFSTICLVAIVAARPLAGLKENPPELDLFFARDAEIPLDPSVEYIMVEERAGFFEAERHTMLALQNMASEPFPLSEYFVQLEKNIKPPSYLLESPMVDLAPVFSSMKQGERVHVFDEWPESPDTTLDKTQISALNRMLTQEMAIVQGPPGTGKTHVSVKALEVMLKSMPPDAPPVVVTCQTNHALDQLLRHIAKFEPNFVRLGSRSKDTELVKKREIFELRSALKLPGYITASMSHSHKALDACKLKMMQIIEPITEDSQSTIDSEELIKLGILTREQAASLERANSEWVQMNEDTHANEQLMANWLGSSLTQIPKAFKRDDHAYEFEEVDPEFEQIQEEDAENPLDADRDEHEALHGIHTSIHIKDSVRMRTPCDDEMCERLLKNSNLYKIDPKYRPAVFQYIQKRVKETVAQKFRVKAKEYSRLVHNRRTAAFERDIAILKQQRIVGLTTTGFSKYRAMIVALRPKIVMIEEAAESLEAPVIAACVPSLQHLILIGDHKQLRPHTHVQKHGGDPVNLNVSLFERLIVNDIKFSVLRRQRRMRPEVRRILRPIYQDDLRDHPSVKDESLRPPVPGMGGINSYFHTHTYPESRDTHQSSVNDWEVHMVANLFEYLVLNGTPEEKITVITFYNGQRKRILSMIRNNQNINGSRVNVSTVDSYQGEENDIVILSLVRSNDNCKIGFLDVQNRVCVALSRSRNGFYIFGNGSLVCGENDTWESVINIMVGKAGELPPAPARRLGFYLPIQCKNHGRKTFIGQPEDWNKIHGGCEIKCTDVLPCGHTCSLNCHPFSHDRATCNATCGKKLGCGHLCTEKCGILCECSQCASYDIPDESEESDDGYNNRSANSVRGPTRRTRRGSKARGNIDLLHDDPNDGEGWEPDVEESADWPTLEPVVATPSPRPIAAAAAAATTAAAVPAVVIQGWRPDVWDGEFDRTLATQEAEDLLVVDTL